MFRSIFTRRKTIIFVDPLVYVRTTPLVFEMSVVLNTDDLSEYTCQLITRLILLSTTLPPVVVLVCQYFRLVLIILYKR